MAEGGSLKKRILEILSGLKIRRYELIREKIIETAQAFPSGARPKKGKPSFSENWWFKFLKNNQDVKEKWEAIPVERTVLKQLKEAKLST